MSDLSPERREEAARAIEAAQVERYGVVIPELSADDAVEALAPLIAGWLAAEREAGAAEVRAQVAAWWADHFGCRLDSCNCRDAQDLRSYLNGGESDV